MTPAVQNLFYPDESFDWLAWRKKGLGGSDAPVIMGDSPWMTRHELWEIKTGRRESPEPTYPMRMGIKNEPVARAWYESQTGIDIPKALAIHPRFDFIRLSLDGFCSDYLLPVEIKCPGKEDHFTALNGQVPEKYVWQLEHYLLVLNLRKIDYVSWNPKYADHNNGEDATYLTYHSDPERQEQLLTALQEFWTCVVKGIPPHPEPPHRRKTMLKLVNAKPSPFKVRRVHKVPAKRKPQVRQEVVSSKYLEPSRQILGTKTFSAQELLEILRTAKELGVSGLKVEGLELEFGGKK